MELESLQKQNPKPIFVWIYADWCTHCKDFKETTLADPKIIAKLNNGDFYPVKLNFEDKRTLTFKGKAYKWIPPTEEKMAHNELPLAMMKNIFGLPSFIFFDRDFHLLQDIKVTKILLILTLFLIISFTENIKHWTGNPTRILLSIKKILNTKM